MKNYPTKINSTYDVRLLFRYLLNKVGIAFHPDDDITDYIDPKKPDLAVFSIEEAEELNLIMQQCFYICDTTGSDIYDIAFQEMKYYILKNYTKNIEP